MNKKPQEKKPKKSYPVTKTLSPNFKHAPPITLGNFIVNKQTSQRQQKRNKLNQESTRLDSPPPAAPKRRINPLRISPKSEPSANPHHGESANPFYVEEQSSSNFKHERLQMRNETSKVLTEIPNLKQLTIEKPVINKEQLDSLSKLYSLILDHDLALNLMTELYFLIELLIVDSMQEDLSKMLGTVQNCVYFASKTLTSQKKIVTVP